MKGKKARVDTVIPGKKIISRKASQLAEVTYDTSKKNIDELTTKYKRGREIVNKERAGAQKLEGDYVLQVPKQKNAIPQNVLNYAKEQDVFIEIVEDVTDAMLKWW